MPILLPALPAGADSSAAKNVPALLQSYSARKMKLGWLNSTHYNITDFYTIAQHGFLWSLFNFTLSYFFSRPWKGILGFLLFHYPQNFCYKRMQQHVSSIQVEFFVILNHYSSSAPAKPKFCNPYVTFLVFVHGEIQSYKLWTRYFQGILEMSSLFSLYLFVCVYFSYKTLFLFEKLNTI